MSKKSFVIPFSIIIIFFTIAVHKGFTTDLQLLEWPVMDDLPGSVWADTHGAKQKDKFFGVDLQIVSQSLAAAHRDRRGIWWVHSYILGDMFANDFDNGDYIDGCYETSELRRYGVYASPDKTFYYAYARVTDTTSGVEVVSDLTDPDDSIPIMAPEDGPFIYATDPNQLPIPGDTYEFIVYTDTPYYWIEVYVKAPWDTNDKGTLIGDAVLGDGELTRGTFSYTFPSGVMNTGDFLITADIWQWGDMSQSAVTHTVTVHSQWASW